MVSSEGGKTPISEIVANRSLYSAKFLYEVAALRFAAQPREASDRMLIKLALIKDIYIKVIGYRVWNRIFFALSLVFSVLLLFWPAVAVLWDSKMKVLPAAVVQTCLTATAAFFIFAYRNFKLRQLAGETLMRRLVYQTGDDARLVTDVIDEMTRIDQGFTFRVPKDETPSNTNGNGANGERSHPPSS